MRPYGQYCPISRAADLLGDRWSLLILRDLLLGSDRFNQIARGNPRLSRSLLSHRLDQLEVQGLVVQGDDGAYRLTPAGEGLQPVLMSLAEWGARWAFGDPTPEELDPDLLLWWLHRNIDAEVVAGRRFVIRVDLTDHPRRYWIVVDPEPSVCRSDPGFEVDVGLAADRTTLYRIHMGSLPFDAALGAGTVTLTGASDARRALVEMLRPSVAAPFVRAALDGEVPAGTVG